MNLAEIKLYIVLFVISKMSEKCPAQDIIQGTLYYDNNALKTDLSWTNLEVQIQQTNFSSEHKLSTKKLNRENTDNGTSRNDGYLITLY